VSTPVITSYLYPIDSALNPLSPLSQAIPHVGKVNRTQTAKKQGQ